MRKQDIKEAEFILENEQKINKTISWLMLPGVVIGIALIVFRALNILRNISYQITAAYAALQLGFWLAARFFIKTNPKKPFYKVFLPISNRDFYIHVQRIARRGDVHGLYNRSLDKLPLF